MDRANPAPLGLMGFGMTTVLLNLHNAGFFEVGAMIIAMGFFYGGMAQVFAGIMEFRKANTFGTTVSSFIGGKEEREFSIVRKEDRTTVSRVGLKEGGKSTYTYESLGAGKAGRKMEPFLVRLQPLSESPTARSVHDGEEFLYVLSGKVTVCLGNLSDVLEEGDSVYYNSTIPHHVHSADEREALILAVIHAGA